MLTIDQSQLPTDEATLRAALTTYQQALADHASTTFQPKPWPQYDIIFAIVENGGDFVVVNYVPPEAPELTLAQQQAVAENAIDQFAGQVRARYITVAAGQEATYMLKADQSQAFKDAGYTGTAPVFVQAEADATGLTAQQAADSILSQEAVWIVKGAAIEKARRAGKIAVEAATTSDAVAAAQSAAITALNAL